MAHQEDSNFHDFFSQNVKILYVFASFAVLIGYVVDTILFFDKFTSVVLTINISVIAIIILFLFLGLSKKMTIKISYLVIIYSTFLGLFLAYIYDIMQGDLISHLLFRNIIIFPMIIFSIGFIVDKKQMLIAGITIAILFPAILVSSKNTELIEITPFITIMVLISTFAMGLFLSSMEKSITENKLKEDELLKQTNRLESLNKDKDNLLSVISHDLRGPVGSAKQMISYLIDNETTNDEKKFLLEAINSSIGNSFNLLSNLLQWAQNEQGVIQLDTKNINITKSVETTITLLQKSADEKNIIIENRFRTEIVSYSDKNLFETIVRNLLANAIKFTNEKGRIIISNQMDDQAITITVKDNGIGVSKTSQKNIFSEFEIVTSRGTKNEKGSGLGLILCKEFTHKNGGKIWFTSEEGVGSEFSFTVPLARVEVTE